MNRTGPCVEETVALTKDRKTALIGEYKKHDKDTGSPEVQIAILSERISYLTEEKRKMEQIRDQTLDALKQADSVLGK